MTLAYPGDCRIRLKEEEKVNKYRDLAFEVKTLWKLKKVTTTHIVIGALEASTDRLEKYLEDIHVGLQAHTMQKTVLLGSARITLPTCFVIQSLEAVVTVDM